MKTHRIAAGIVALGLTIGATAAPVGAAEDDLGTFQRRFGKYAGIVPAPGKQPCVCLQAGMMPWAGVLTQTVTGSSPKRVLVTCLVPGFDVTGEVIMQNNCLDFVPLAK